MRYLRWAQARVVAVVARTGQYRIEDCQACGGKYHESEHSAISKLA